MINTFNTDHSQEPETAGQEGPTIIGLDLDETLRLVVAATREDCPLPIILDRQKFRSKEGLQRYFAAHQWGEKPIVALTTEVLDPYGVVEWLSSQELTIDCHAHPLWSSAALKLNEESAMWEIPRAYDTAYALAFLSSYRRQAERTACRLWNQTYCLEEILTEFKCELQRLSHALQPTGLLESQKKGLCPF